jgi:hypothetical protein
MIEQDRPLRTTTMASFAGTGNRVDSLFFPCYFPVPPLLFSAEVSIPRAFLQISRFACPLYRDLQAGLRA